MPSIESASRFWRARLRTRVGCGRSGWVAWLIVALIGVQIWGLQHEILHARRLSGVPPVLADASRSAAGEANDPNEAGGADLAMAADGRAQAVGTVSVDFGNSHHHCHLFEGATLAAAMAVAVLSWGSDTVIASLPQRATGRRHPSVHRRPFDSRAPPLAI